jgi:hypothetical protein
LRNTQKRKLLRMHGQNNITDYQRNKAKSAKHETETRRKNLVSL